MAGNPVAGWRLRATLDPANGPVRGHHATLGRTIFEIAQARAEARVRPPGMTDDGRWEAVTSVPGFHQTMVEGRRQAGCARIRVPDAVSRPNGRNLQERRAPPALQGPPHPADLADHVRTLPPNRCGLAVIADQPPTIAEPGSTPGDNPVTGARDKDRAVAELLPRQVHQNQAAVRHRRLHGRPYGASHAAMPRLESVLAQPLLTETQVALDSFVPVLSAAPACRNNSCQVPVQGETQDRNCHLSRLR